MNFSSVSSLRCQAVRLHLKTNFCAQVALFGFVSHLQSNTYLFTLVTYSSATPPAVIYIKWSARGKVYGLVPCRLVTALYALCICIWTALPPIISYSTSWFIARLTISRFCSKEKIWRARTGKAMPIIRRRATKKDQAFSTIVSTIITIYSARRRCEFACLTKSAIFFTYSARTRNILARSTHPTFWGADSTKKRWIFARNT